MNQAREVIVNCPNCGKPISEFHLRDPGPSTFKCHACGWSNDDKEESYLQQLQVGVIQAKYDRLRDAVGHYQALLTTPHSEFNLYHERRLLELKAAMFKEAGLTPQELAAFNAKILQELADSKDKSGGR